MQKTLLETEEAGRAPPKIRIVKVEVDPQYIIEVDQAVE